MKYKVLLCDADGVVVRGDKKFSEQLELVYGIPKEKLHPFFEGPFALCSVGKADLKVELGKVIGEWGWKGTVDELIDFWFTKGTVLDQDVVEYVDAFRSAGVRCLMTTDNEEYRSRLLISKVGHGHPFEKVFYSAALGFKKKQPGFFEQVYEKLDGIPREQVLFIDDDQQNVEIAKQFGFDAHFYENLAGLKSKLES